MKNKDRFITSPKIGHGFKKRTELISIILFSENHGYRMKSYGPIPLIQISGQSLLERQINSIKSSFSNFEIILCSGFETEKTVSFIKDNFGSINIRVVENQVHYNSNCCESARLCMNNTTNTRLLLCGGGVLFTHNHLDIIDVDVSTVIYQNQQNDTNFEVGIVHNDNLLEGLSIGVKDQYWTEILYLNGKRSIKSLYSILSNPEYKNRFIFEAINELLNKNEISVKQNTNKPIVKINNIKNLKRITKI